MTDYLSLARVLGACVFEDEVHFTHSQLGIFAARIASITLAAPEDEQKLPEHWLPLGMIGALAARKYAEEYARAARVAQAPQAAEPLTPEVITSLEWLDRLCEPRYYLDRLGPLRDLLKSTGWARRTK